MTRRATLAPLVVLAAATVATAVLGSRTLEEAERTLADVPSLVPLVLTALTSLVSAAAVIVQQSFRFSYTVAGPAYRLRRSMVQLREGDFSFRVRLRRGDELQELAAELNQVLEWLERRDAKGVERGAVATPAAAPVSVAAGSGEGTVG